MEEHMPVLGMIASSTLKAEESLLLVTPLCMTDEDAIHIACAPDTFFEALMEDPDIHHRTRVDVRTQLKSFAFEIYRLLIWLGSCSSAVGLLVIRITSVERLYRLTFPEALKMKGRRMDLTRLNKLECRMDGSFARDAVGAVNRSQKSARVARVVGAGFQTAGTAGYGVVYINRGTTGIAGEIQIQQDWNFSPILRNPTGGFFTGHCVSGK
ncbi:hypothetical protein P691DRAFT_784876 [Macrolepiota fuliginosa MF-IS2]|uniref:Uncharacterized protein n=1 Tax=Macrolepiota fuliginosa MF-IS2 TaxID=1400762 RepID=A0A9P5X741_9AGAR|nr:hypothetical protein P691DRAFT_784876 [Macrolepiota fuliginosa MF-IS2]